MGIKVDAIPGRLNQFDLFIKRTGIFFGQCSEICGIGHGFMPIELHSVSYLNFLIGPIDRAKMPNLETLWTDGFLTKDEFITLFKQNPFLQYK